MNRVPAVVVKEDMVIGTYAPSTVFDRELVWAGAAQLVVLGGVAACVGLGSAGWAAGLAFALVVGILLVSHDSMGRARAAGAANQVTLARATLVGGVTALVAEGTQGPGIVVLVAIGAVALALDGLDGYLARRFDTVSALGARFDMEVDAFLILVLSVLVCRSLGPWVLAIGLMRYAFVAAMHFVPALRAQLPFSRARKVVAAMQGGMLVAAAAPFVPRPLAVVLVATALVALVWSFGRDVRWLLAHST
jgi:phosphatidylglycerophosphate synthase